MNSVKLTGVINTIFPREQVTPNFEKRVFWLDETGAKYPSTWSIEMWHDSVNDLDMFSVGELISCTVDVLGKLWQKGEKSAVFTTLKCTELIKMNRSEHHQREQNPLPPQQITHNNTFNKSEDVDDAPF